MTKELARILILRALEDSAGRKRFVLRLDEVAWCDDTRNLTWDDVLAKADLDDWACDIELERAR